MWRGFSWIDATALTLFFLVWCCYGQAVERRNGAGASLNACMHRFRREWMDRALERDMRIFDASLMGSLQSGASFFASTALLAVGGALASLRATDAALRVATELPLATAQSRQVWEIKVIGLALILGLAFFRFAWSYRLFNYAAILLGATPPPDSGAIGKRHARRTAAMQISAGTHFNRGQRSIFFALAYLGWLLGPLLLMATTTMVVVALWRRQFHSAARMALLRPDEQDDAAGP